ncbi:hypothetical protein ERJ75_001808100 [Trypanosoma vivax]|nr:hypothetical protein TRVL_08777 [Trypanosoma vivax]KAH8603607.1 hypothetical protein ERJ75_001808100 [Trypanosoma vivax]
MDGITWLTEEMKRIQEGTETAEAQETVRVAAQELALVLEINDTKCGFLCKMRAHLSALKIGIGEVRVPVEVGVVSSNASRVTEVHIEVADMHLRIRHYSNAAGAIAKVQGILQKAYLPLFLGFHKLRTVLKVTQC